MEEVERLCSVITIESIPSPSAIGSKIIFMGDCHNANELWDVDCAPTLLSENIGGASSYDLVECAGGLQKKKKRPGIHHPT
jgi:hypothetical protein